MSQTVVIMLGPPGAGKGTQAERICAALEVPHVSTGDLFRVNLAGDTALGKEARQYMDSGELVPDQLVIEMLFDRVTADDCARGYLLDGFPRTTTQAEALESRLAGQPVRVLSLDVPEDVLVDRLAGRGRDDDKPDVVRQRLVVYREQTEPLIDFYQGRGVLHQVDGNRSQDDVFASLMQHLEQS